MKKTTLISICIILIVSAGCAIQDIAGLKKRFGYSPVSSIAISADEAATLSQSVPIHLYFYNENERKLSLEVRNIAIKEARKTTEELAGVIVSELIKGPIQNNTLKPTIPLGTKMVKEIKINNGVAEVDFSKEYLAVMKSNKDECEFSLFSVVNSLTELKEIDKVTIKVNNKGLDGMKFPLERKVELISLKTSSIDEDSVTEILE